MDVDTTHPMNIQEALKAISDGFKVQNTHGDIYFRVEKTLEDAYDGDKSLFGVAVSFADCGLVSSFRKDGFAIHEIFDKYAKVNQDLVGAGDKVFDVSTGKEYVVIETSVGSNDNTHNFIIGEFSDITKPFQIIAYKQWKDSKIDPSEITEDTSKKPIKLKKVTTDGKS